MLIRSFALPWQAAALAVGFAGALVVDFPHPTPAKKLFLCLVADAPATTTSARERRRATGRRPLVPGLDWECRGGVQCLHVPPG